MKLPIMTRVENCRIVQTILSDTEVTHFVIERIIDGRVGHISYRVEDIWKQNYEVLTNICVQTRDIPKSHFKNIRVYQTGTAIRKNNEYVRSSRLECHMPSSFDEEGLPYATMGPNKGTVFDDNHLFIDLSKEIDEQCHNLLWTHSDSTAEETEEEAKQYALEQNKETKEKAK